MVTNYLGNTTTALIRNGAHVSALGTGNPIQVDRWANDANGTDAPEMIHGLAVIASTDESITDIATTVSASLTVGVGFNFEVNIFKDSTTASITGSIINSTANTGQDVIVRAHDAIDVSSAGGTLAGGVAGVGGVVDTDVYTSVTQASIGSSTVYAGGDVEASAPDA